MEIIKNDNDLKTDEKLYNKNKDNVIKIIPINKSLNVFLSIISLCLIACISTNTIILKLTIDSRIIILFDDIKYRNNNNDIENNSDVSFVDLFGKYIF